LLKRIYALIILLLPLLIFTLLYYPYLFSDFDAAESRSNISVMTYNVLFSNKQYDAVANVILTYQPDLVALQEVQPEMMNELIQRLGDAYPYSQMGTQNKFGTTAIFSRTPFSQNRILDLQADRPAVLIATQIRGETVTFAAVHLLALNLGYTPMPNIPR